MSTAVFHTPSGRRCQFLVQDDDAKLAQAFTNYLSLGQFELARALYFRLLKSHPRAAHDIVDTLIAVGPPLEWLCSISVPSSSHLAWLCTTLTLEEEDDGGPRYPKWKYAQLEFDILLTEALLDRAAAGYPCLNPDVVAQLRYIYFCAIRADVDARRQVESHFSDRFIESVRMANHRLPELQLLPIPGFLPPVKSFLAGASIFSVAAIQMGLEILEQLKQIMLEQPLLGRAIWSMLQSALHVVDDHRRALQDMCITVIAKCFSENHYEEALWFMQKLPPPAASGSNDAGVDELFSSLIILLRDQDNDDTSAAAQRHLSRLGGELKSPKSSGSVWRKKPAGASQSKNRDNVSIASDGFPHNGAPDTSGENRAGEVFPDAGGDIPQHGMLERRYLYAALLGEETTLLLARYCLLEDIDLRDRLEQSTLPAPFVNFHTRASRMSSDSWARFWGDIFTLMWVTKQHCLEFVLQKGLEFVHRRDFENTAKLLAPFPKLQPLLFILSVDHPSVADIRAKQQLIDALWRPSAGREERLRSDARIAQWCDQISFVVDFTWWYTRHFKATAPEERVQGANAGVWKAEVAAVELDAGDHRIANSVLDAFNTMSVLAVIRESLPTLDTIHCSLARLNVGQTEDNELVSLLLGRPQGASDIDGEHRHNLVLLRAYYALKQVLAWFDLSSQIRATDSHTRRRLQTDLQIHIRMTVKQVSHNITSIQHLPSRVTVMENMFQLLFATTSDVLRNGPGSTAPSTSSKVAEEEASQTVDGKVNLPSQTTLYIADAALSSVVLLLLDDCLEKTLNELDKRGDDSSQREDLSRERASSLREHVQEGIERLRVVEASKQHFRRKPSQFMSRMLASPESLLNVCLKRRDYVLAKRMILNFGLPPSRSLEVAVAEKLDDVSARLNESWSRGSQDLPAYSNLVQELIEVRSSKDAQVGKGKSLNVQSEILDTHLHAFYMTVDLAVSAAPTMTHSNMLLKEAQAVLDRWLRLLQEEDSEMTFSRRLHSYFSNLVIRRYSKLIDNERQLVKKAGGSIPPLWMLLKQVENMPMEPTILESHLSQKQSRVQALDSLRNVFDKVKVGGTKDVRHVDQLMQSFIKQFTQDSEATSMALSDSGSLKQQDVSASPVEQQYLLNFLRYIMTIGNNMRAASVRLHASQKSLDIMEILDRSPREILAKLVFELNGFDEAVHLSGLMRLDLMKVIVRSSQPIEGNIDSEQTSFSLKMNVVKFLATLEEKRTLWNTPVASPIIASLSCLRRRSYPRLNGEFVNYALKQSQAYPTLNRWMCLRAQNMANFINLFFPANATPLPPQPTRQDSTGPSSFFLNYGVNDFRMFGEFRYGEDEGQNSATDDADECLTLLEQESVSGEQRFYGRAIEKLQAEQQPMTALHLADTFLAPRSTKTEELLQQIVGALESKNDAHLFIWRMENRVEAAELTCKYLREFTVDKGIQLLYMCICRLRGAAAGRCPTIFRTVVSEHAKLKTYKDIMRIDGDHFKSWQRIAMLCETDPESVIKRLQGLQKHELANQVMSQWDLNAQFPALKAELLRSHILHLLVTVKETQQAFTLLEALECEEAASLAIDLMRPIENLSIKLLLVQFAIHMSSSAADNSSLDLSAMAVVELSLKVLTRIPRHLQDNYRHLIGLPKLLVESLLLDKHIKHVALLFREFEELRDDHLVERAAGKALDFSRVGRPVDRTKTLVLESVRLTGDFRGDNELRARHIFPESPNITLCTSILDLTSDHDSERAGFICLRLCAKLSLHFADNSARIRPRLLQSVLRHLFTYARRQFGAASRRNHAGEREKITFGTDILGTGSKGRVTQCSLCIKALPMLIKLHGLLRKEAAQQEMKGVTILDMGDPRKTMRLRDLLMEKKIDRLHTALNLSRICHLDPSPVYTVWGLTLLRVCKYKEAREKFCGSLPTMSRRDAATAVGRIIATLENCSAHPHELSRLQHQHASFAFSILRSSTQENSRMNTSARRTQERALHGDGIGAGANSAGLSGGRTSKDAAAVRDECLFYLREYGVPRQLVEFYARRKEVAKALQEHFRAGLSEEIFTSTILDLCVSTSRLSEMLSALSDLDRPRAQILPFMEATCKWLFDRRFFTLLHQVQVFMGDQLGAGLTCERLFAKARDYDQRVGHLYQAKEHFSMAARETFDLRCSKLTLRNFELTSGPTSVKPGDISEISDVKVSSTKDRIVVEGVNDSTFPRTTTSGGGRTSSASNGQGEASLTTFFTTKTVLARVSQIDAQISIADAMPGDKSPGLVLINIGLPDLVGSDEMQQRRLEICGLLLLAGHTNITRDVLRAFSLEAVEGLAAAMYMQMRDPDSPLAMRILRASTTHDVVSGFIQRFSALKSLFSAADWRKTLDAIIDKVGVERVWWLRERKRGPEAIPNRLLRLLGKTLNPDFRLVTKLAIFSGDVAGAREFASKQRPFQIALELMAFVVAEAPSAADSGEMKKCRDTLQALKVAASASQH